MRTSLRSALALLGLTALSACGNWFGPAVPPARLSLPAFYIADAQVEGKSFLLVLDSGARVSLVSESVLAGLTKTRIATVTIQTASGLESGPLYSIPVMRVETCTLRDVLVFPISDATANNIQQTAVDGALGIQAIDQLVPITVGQNGSWQPTCH